MTKQLSFTYSTGRVVRGNADPRDYPNDTFLQKLPIGTMLVIDGLFDPATCRTEPACGLFQKCSEPGCDGSTWSVVIPPTPACDPDDPDCEPTSDDCCPDQTQVLAGGDFADPNMPTTAEVDAYIAANGPFNPNTYLVYVDPSGNGWVWATDADGNAILIEAAGDSVVSRECLTEITPGALKIEAVAASMAVNGGVAESVIASKSDNASAPPPAFVSTSLEIDGVDAGAPDSTATVVGATITYQRDEWQDNVGAAFGKWDLNAEIANGMTAQAVIHASSSLIRARPWLLNFNEADCEVELQFISSDRSSTPALLTDAVIYEIEDSDGAIVFQMRQTPSSTDSTTDVVTFRFEVGELYTVRSYFDPNIAGLVPEAYETFANMQFQVTVNTDPAYDTYEKTTYASGTIEWKDAAGNPLAGPPANEASLVPCNTGIVLPTTAFADVDNPTTAEVETWLATNGAFFSGEFVTFGTCGDTPGWSWYVKDGVAQMVQSQ